MDHATRAVTAVILAGSNLDKERCIPESIRLLRRHPGINVRAVSSCYESSSVGGPADAPDFFNAAALVTTALLTTTRFCNGRNDMYFSLLVPSVGFEPTIRTLQERLTSTSCSTTTL